MPSQRPHARPFAQGLFQYPVTAGFAVKTVAAQKPAEQPVMDKFDDIDDYYDKVAERICKLKKDQMPKVSIVLMFTIQILKVLMVSLMVMVQHHRKF